MSSAMTKGTIQCKTWHSPCSCIGNNGIVRVYIEKLVLKSYLEFRPSGVTFKWLRHSPRVASSRMGEEESIYITVILKM